MQGILNIGCSGVIRSMPACGAGGPGANPGCGPIKNNENQRLICWLKPAVFALDFQYFQRPHPLPEVSGIRPFENNKNKVKK